MNEPVKLSNGNDGYVFFVFLLKGAECFLGFYQYFLVFLQTSKKIYIEYGALLVNNGDTYSQTQCCFIILRYFGDGFVCLCCWTRRTRTIEVIHSWHSHFTG